MDKIKIRTDFIISENASVGTQFMKLSNFKQDISALRSQIDSNIKSRRNISIRMIETYNELVAIETKVKNLYAFFINAMDIYNRTENKLVHKSYAISQAYSVHSRGANLAKAGKSEEGFLYDNSIGRDIKALIDLFGKTWDKKISGFFGNDLVGFVSDLIGQFSANVLLLLPKFKIDGKYVKLLNSKYYKGGEGLSRWYTVENIKNKKYPKATKLFNVAKVLQKTTTVVGKVVTPLAYGGVMYDEFTTTEKISTERKVTNTIVAGAEVFVAAKAGAAAGAFVGSVIPGAGTVIGAAVGAVVGAGVAYGTHKLLKDWKIWGKDEKKSTFEVAKDFAGDLVESKPAKTVGNAIKGAAQWVGGVFNSKPKPAT